jgi:hypothetical protein
VFSDCTSIYVLSAIYAYALFRLIKFCEHDTCIFLSFSLFERYYQSDYNAKELTRQEYTVRSELTPTMKSCLQHLIIDPGTLRNTEGTTTITVDLHQFQGKGPGRCLTIAGIVDYKYIKTFLALSSLLLVTTVF